VRKVLCVLLSLMFLPLLSGCGWEAMATKELITEGFGIRRMIVQDDWVYVKAENKLYRRYIPGRGIGPFRILHGNKVMLAAVPKPHRPISFLDRIFKGPFDGKIMKGRKVITVYGNYTKAVKAHPDAPVSEESKAFVPKKKEPPAWWAKRRLEKPWEPGD